MRPKIYNQFFCSSPILPKHREALKEYQAEEYQREAEYNSESRGCEYTLV